MTKYTKMATCVAVALSLTACSGGSGNVSSTSSASSTPSAPVQLSQERIKVNQLGYIANFSKLAVVPQTSADSFNVRRAGTNALVTTIPLSDLATWAPSGESVKLADFSNVQAPGEYYIEVDGFNASDTFSISDDVYGAVHDAAMKAYYFNRASVALEPEFAGEWARPAGHPDTNVKVHSSAASQTRPEGTIISAPKGWYDAGDYNKYIVNSGISTYTLLASYLHHPDFYRDRNGSIPESDNGFPDILDEVLWNTEWMEAMQDPDDGGVYHKLTTLNFADAVMPHEATAPRYVVQKGTGAALNYAATMATASRVLGAFSEYEATAERYLQSAARAFMWAVNNPNVPYLQPSDVQTGAYDDVEFDGEFAWAAAELFLTSGNTNYLDVFKQSANGARVPGWQDTMGLAYMSLLAEGKSRVPSDIYDAVEQSMLSLADSIVEQHNQSAYGVAMVASDFVWGSSGVAANKAMMLMQAYKVTRDTRYRQAALGIVDYLFGKNPNDISYVTGWGERTSLDPHHRPSYADNVSAPVPGFIVGGPHTGRQDGCQYTGTYPATTYSDTWCSYATNEVTINWNAPLVYVLAALHTDQ